MAKTSKNNIDFAALQEKLASQFRGLNPNDPSTWPAIPRYGLCLLLAIAVVTALWFLWLQGSADELKVAQDKEITLREDYKKKLVQAVNLETLKKQREQVQQYVTQLEKQLPSKAEIDALLSDINQAGLGRSLQFESFKPGAVAVKEYYAELPIALKITGKYHDIGAFAADVANLSRIVTLNNLSVTPGAAKDGTLVLDSTARTYRYLDPEEIKAQRAAAAPAGAPKK
ncbi:type 4a pilus biogenesis protein PilO [Variovorax sp. PCZ-1]|uniref:type 4a pilus biogenesis protein PilO n=1 Tax=Variovorax sp. PCZ-1 TaxID=2835533 RepID=UPI001BCD1A2C|nr:type 4a pilus biogenesis protein PilO [Variovorax sp. PCZ-1]MBS7808416.1 type 4a pilus biogenesis protein PilO [Variovorax sp. PCZ-1]